jgi:hypothetical protein
MATSNGKSVGRPPHVHSRIRDGQHEPSDEISGGWTPERLLQMNDRFVERVERAIACGLESRPRETEQARHCRESTVRANENRTPCAHCGNAFTPIRSDMKYCSIRCRQLAYHHRLKLAEMPHDLDREIPVAGGHR